MLVYHPAFDSYHCLFRSIAILEIYSEIDIDRLRILDFCLSFPAMVAKFRLSGSTISVKKTALTFANPYRDPINSKAMFLNLAPIQTAAYSCLTATGLAIMKSNVISLTDAALPQVIKQRCLDLRSEEKVFFENMITVLMEIPLLGVDGIKSRSGLMEYRYDTI